jgi:hypothetical protein
MHCIYAESHILFIVMLSVIMLNVVMLSVIMPNAIMLSVVMLSVVALSKRDSYLEAKSESTASHANTR